MSAEDGLVCKKSYSMSVFPLSFYINFMFLYKYFLFYINKCYINGLYYKINICDQKLAISQILGHWHYGR